MYSFLSDAGSKVILKKLDTLSYNEFEKKNKILDIKSGDILLVDDLDVRSEKTMDFLKGKVDFVVFGKASKKTLDVAPFLALDKSLIKIDENEFFAFVDKDELEFNRHSTA